MPSKQVTVEPELVVEHKGVKVYRTYLDDDLENPEQFIFTTRPNDTDSCSPAAFDIREITSLDLLTDRPELVDDRIARKHGLELTEYVLTPDYLARKAAWQEWWDVTMPGLIRQAIIAAIDGGNIN